jgi:hypothetical protein
MGRYWGSSHVHGSDGGCDGPPGGRPHRRGGRRLVATRAAGVVALPTRVGGVADADDVPGELLAVERVREPVAANFSRLVFDERLEPLWYELGWVNGSGVRIITGCVAHPTAGAMGYHYINAELMDDLVADPLEPEALVYESAPDGGLKLVAVEWIVRGPQSNPPGVPAGAPAPRVLGMDMHILVPPPGPAFYLMHAWIWKHNPAGMFADWNPEVTCP